MKPYLGLHLHFKPFHGFGLFFLKPFCGFGLFFLQTYLVLACCFFRQTCLLVWYCCAYRKEKNPCREAFPPPWQLQCCVPFETTNLPQPPSMHGRPPPWWIQCCVPPPAADVSQPSCRQRLPPPWKRIHHWCVLHLETCTPFTGWCASFPCCGS